MKKFFAFLFKKKKVVFIQKKTILVIFLLVFIMEGLIFLKIFQIIPYEKFLASIMSELLIDLTNEERSSQNLTYLTINSVLEEAAILKAEDMAEKGYFAHTSPEGITPWYWFEKTGYSFSYAGENLAVNFIDSTILHQAWLSSPKHRANILNEKFTEIGIGTAEGIYKGRNAIFVVQLFGRPRSLISLTQQNLSKLEPESELQLEPRVQQEEKQKEIIPKSSVLVLGEEESKENEKKEQIFPQIEVIEQRDYFIAVKNLEQDSGKDEDFILSAEDREIKYSSLMARILSSPKRTINFLLMFLGLLFICLGIFSFVKKPRINFYSLAINGAIVFLIIGGAIWANHWIFSFFGFIL